MLADAQPAPVPLAQQDVATLHQLIAEQQAAWDGGNGILWAQRFTADALFINIRGERFVGRDSIAQLHTRILGGPFRASTAAVTVSSLRQLTPDDVLVETEYIVTGFAALPPGVQPTEPARLHTRMTLLAHRSASQWQWTFAQNTAVLPVAGPPGPHAGPPPTSY